MGLKKVPKSMKICCIVTTILIITIFLIMLVLCLTIFKLKQPKVTTQAITLENFKWVPPFELNVTLGISVRIDNPNYGGFRYKTSAAFVTYHGDFAAEAPIKQDMIPARSKHDINTTAVVLADHVIFNKYFLPDITSGVLNFTSSTTLQGKAIVLKLFKIKATAMSTCDISIFVLYSNASSVCHSKVKY